MQYDQGTRWGAGLADSVYQTKSLAFGPGDLSPPAMAGELSDEPS